MAFKCIVYDVNSFLEGFLGNWCDNVVGLGVKHRILVLLWSETVNG